MAYKVFYVLVLIIVYVTSFSSADTCIEQTSCSCKIDEDSFINLSQLSGADGKFYQDRENNVSYYFAGCEDKEFKSSDYNLWSKTNFPSVSLVRCIENWFPNNGTNASFLANHTCEAIGFAKHAKFSFPSSNLNQYQLVYTNNSDNRSLPSIILVCDNYFNKTDLKIFSRETNILTLYSPQACVQKITHNKLSSGSVFCIIFFVAAITYFIGGGLIMYFIRGARGIEAIPNFDFWVSLPGLIRDGLVFVLGGCRPFTVSTAETYDRI